MHLCANLVVLPRRLCVEGTQTRTRRAFDCRRVCAAATSGPTAQGAACPSGARQDPAGGVRASAIEPSTNCRSRGLQRRYCAALACGQPKRTTVAGCPTQRSPAFFSSVVRAQATALACTLPQDSGRPLSRWSSAELAQRVHDSRIAPAISAATIRRWLRQERIKPWQYRYWQKPTDPRFLEKAAVVLRLYERAAALARQGQIIICADEKTCMQALTVGGGVEAAGPGRSLRLGCRYRRQGILNLFAALLVHTGRTMARCFERKRFVEFQDFLRMIFGSLWCQGIRVVHSILDNGSTHAPKQIDAWIESLQLPVEVRIHWLPINASWLDQVEIVFSPLQRKALTPNHFQDRQQLSDRVLSFLEERNRHARPIRWSYTVADLRQHMRKPLRACA